MQPQFPPKTPHPCIHTHFHTQPPHCSHAPVIHHHHHHHPPCPHIHIPLRLLYHHHHYHHHHHNHHPLFHPSSQVSNAKEQVAPPSAIGLEQEEPSGNLELEEEDADDVFVMTDEWKEFFAKSEAKRRLKKQQQQKGGK